jgi:hypothetical protein
MVSTTYPSLLQEDYEIQGMMKKTCIFKNEVPKFITKLQVERL